MKAALAHALALFDSVPYYCIMEWCCYKGETLVAQPNVAASMKAGRPMLDLSYCMTEAINQNIMRTVLYEPAKFEPSTLTPRPRKRRGKAG